MKEFSVLLIVLFLFSCSDKKENLIPTKNQITQNISFPAEGPVSVKKYETQADIHYSVTAELGGNGFEEIADSLGFNTNTDFHIDGDPGAIKGGILIDNFGNYPNTLRPYGKDASITGIQMICDYVYETMMEIDYKTMKFIPALATHWKVSDDKMEYYFRLNPKARWSDGKEVTTDDIVKTWELLTDEKIIAPYTNEYFNKFEKPEAVSKYIVKIKAKELNWVLQYSLAAMKILPAHYLSKIDGSGFLEKYQFNMLPGTGPYIIDEERSPRGTQISLRRRSDYWAINERRNIGRFNFDELRNMMIMDEILEKEKFKKGEIDLYGIGRAQWWVNEFDGRDEMGETGFDYLDRGLIQKRKSYNFTAQGFGGIVFNMRKPPFDDIRVRQAFIMLWNREQLIEKLFFNEYNVTYSRYPGSIYENPNNPKWSYNPDKAAKLLDEAGWSKRNEKNIRMNDKGELFEIVFPIDQSSERYFTPLQEELRKAGIVMNLKITDSNQIIKMDNEHRFTLLERGWAGTMTPNPERMFHSKYADIPNTANTSGMKNGRIDELCEKYFGMFDPQERVKALQEIDSISASYVDWAYKWNAPYAARMAYWNKFGMPQSFVPYYSTYKNSISTLWWYDKDKAELIEKAKADKSIILPKGKTDIDYWGVKKNRAL
ncbi:MAG: hypothetical protein JXR48_06920 [Candidatus Delongbacteria bacterium]|nr:hypothetical protein [Candidatus Delongbacteria bacterium]MBN2834683.1 hypothetical protein [Candidatus Delongbacteria bacterium]